MIATSELVSPEKFSVRVERVSYRGFSPEEVAERCANRILSIADSAPPAIREQAFAFKKQLVQLVSFYIREGIKSDRTTLYNDLSNAGHKDLAELIRRM
jgi:hypothetical protein